MVRKIILLTTTFIISGCIGAMPTYKSSNSALITFKTPTIKYSDMGFIDKADSETKVEIYSNGQSVMRLRITPTQVCMSKLACMSAQEFNKKVLQANYPKDTLEKIFKGEEIFGGKNKIETQDGFVQQIDSIRYEVSQDEILFTDSSTGTTIRIKKI
ncbi:MAG: hypothetical protein GXN91_02090 [Epsilonproteobacteria bacterium]|nr:hypothetical protein [Campylobacterota bacterium]